MKKIYFAFIALLLVMGASAQQEFAKHLAEAKTAYAAGKLDDSRFAMQQALQIRGYPTISVLNLQKDPAGKYNIEVLGQTGYTPTAEQFISTVEKMVNP